MYWNPHYGRKKNAKGVFELTINTTKIRRQPKAKILYEGMWDLDKFQGQGKWCHLNGKPFYKGYFEKGNPQCDPTKDSNITLLDDNGKQLFTGSWVDWFAKFPDYRDQIKIPAVAWGNPYLYQELFAPQLEEIESIPIGCGHDTYVSLINRVKLWLAEQEALGKVTMAMSSLVPKLGGFSPGVAAQKGKRGSFFKSGTEVDRLEEMQGDESGLNLNKVSTLMKTLGPINETEEESEPVDVDLKNFFNVPIQEEEESEVSIDVGPKGKNLKPLDLVPS